MHTKLFTRIAVLSLIAVIGLTGCRHAKAPAQGAGGPGSTDEGIPSLRDSGGIGQPDRIKGEFGPRGEFPAVLFDFDSARVRPSEVSKLETVAAALRGNSKKLAIEGHADERGTAEYNRALGERRALACREELAGMGISANRISTISYGEDRPFDMGHDDGAWAQNRRCEFITVTP